MNFIGSNVINLDQNPWLGAPESGIEIVHQKLFDGIVPVEKRQNWASIAASFFGDRRFNASLLEKLIAQDEDEQCVAAIALGFPGNRQVLPSLLQAYDKGSSRVRQAIVFAIAGLKDNRSDPVLADVLMARLLAANEQKLEDGIVKAILVGLRVFHEPQITKVFLRHLDHPSEEIRIAALRGLLYGESLDDVCFARAFLTSQSSKERRIALMIFERHGTRADLESAMPLLKDPDAAVAKQASWTIGRIKARG